MKLVEILARELEVWPPMSNDEAWQSEHDLEVYFGWDSFYPSIAADERGACNSVTREQWQAERARLAEPKSWDGDGVPPVGAVCEVSLDFDKHPSETNRAVIKVVHSDEWVVVGSIIESENGYDKGVSVAHEANIYEFRPWLTPEQIAAAEREAAIGEMLAIYMTAESAHEGMAMLYDDGYRKP